MLRGRLVPELPEVEIGARNLRRWIRGARIERVVAPATRVIRGATPRAIAGALEGHVVASIDRRGKWIRLVLDDDARAFSHFGMSGKWVRRTAGDEALPHERLRIDVRRGERSTSVRYVDPRMFGRFLVARDDVAEWTSLGPDPLVDGVDGATLARVLAGRRRTIKEALMDQTVVAGVGNIQATEALWRAKIDPRARADALDRRALSSLARAIRWTIDRTLAEESGPEITYVEEAGAENPFVIYGRAGEPCPRCGRALESIVLGGRTTVLCARCQRHRDARVRVRDA